MNCYYYAYSISYCYYGYYQSDLRIKDHKGCMKVFGGRSVLDDFLSAGPPQAAQGLQLLTPNTEVDGRRAVFLGLGFDRV